MTNYNVNNFRPLITHIIHG